MSRRGFKIKAKNQYTWNTISYLPTPYRPHWSSLPRSVAEYNPLLLEHGIKYHFSILFVTSDESTLQINAQSVTVWSQFHFSLFYIVCNAYQIDSEYQSKTHNHCITVSLPTCPIGFQCVPHRRSVSEQSLEVLKNNGDPHLFCPFIPFYTSRLGIQVYSKTLKRKMLSFLFWSARSHATSWSGRQKDRFGSLATFVVTLMQRDGTHTNGLTAP